MSNCEKASCKLKICILFYGLKPKPVTLIQHTFFLCTISHFHRLKNKRNSYNSNMQEQIDANYSHLISPSDFKGLAPNKAIWPQNL